MKSGNIFVDKEGTDINIIDVNNRDHVLHDYIDMIGIAYKNRDKFFSFNGILSDIKDWFSCEFSILAPKILLIKWYHNNRFWHNSCLFIKE